MKTIKPGNDTPWTKRWVCKGCGAEKEADESDLKPHGYHGEANTVAFLICNTKDCGEKIGMGWQDFPTPVWNRLNNRRAYKPSPGPKD
jgi:hypothetical protein